MNSISDGDIRPPSAGTSPNRWAYALIILLAFLCAACVALPEAKDIHPPAQIALLLDPTGDMDINQASSPELSGQYEIVNRNRVSLGFNRSPVWVRIALDQAPANGPWILDVAAPWMDRLDFFTPKADGGWLKLSSGLQQPCEKHRLGLFCFQVSADSPRKGYAYLRMQSVLSLNAGLRIYSRSAFEEHAIVETYLFGALFGVMAAMLLFNTLVLLATRDRVYLAYILYMCSIIVHQLCLQGQILFLPHSLWHLVPAISLVAAALLILFSGEFILQFLNTKEHAPLIHKILRFLQGLGLVLLVLAISNHIWYGTWLIHSLAIVAPLVAIAAGFRALAKGFRPARYYLLAWCVLLIGSIAWGAWSMGLNLMLPLPRSLLTIAAALESILLSIALADRIRAIQLERQILAQRERRYRHLSLTDELTGLFNARYFWSKLDSEIMLANQNSESLGLVLLDVDDFKVYNDTYGHTEGDKVLAVLGKLMQKTVRINDSPCRYGGEEFALLLPGADGQAVWEVGERIRLGFAAHEFEPGPGAKVKVTVSLGTAQLQLNEDARSLVKRADGALYEAKAKGKNVTVEAVDQVPIA